MQTKTTGRSLRPTDCCLHIRSAVKDLGFDGPSFAFPDMDGKIFLKIFLFSFQCPKHFPNH